MKINAFDIYEFGNLAKQSLKNLPSGLIIFLGQNEAGKSTSLEFFRTLLTGFPASRTKKAREGIFAQKTANTGGILELDTKYASSLKIERTLNSFQVFNHEGKALPQSVYENLLAGTNRDIYSALYAFSLNELQTLDTLEAEEVRTVLYGTSFGLGLYSPQKALTQIDSALNSKGTKSLIHNESFRNFFKTNCLALEDINHKIKEYTEKNKAIDTFYQEYELEQEHLQVVREEKAQKQEKLHFLKTKIQAWQIYTQWHLTEQKIQRVPNNIRNFPLEKLENLRQMQNELLGVQQQEKTLETKKKQIQGNIDKKHFNLQLVEHLEEIKQLVEYKASYRNAFIQRPKTLYSIQKTEEELKKQLHYLGENWSIEKIRSLDYSLNTHESIEEFHIKIEDSEQQLRQSQALIEQLIQEKQLIENDIISLNENIKSLPKQQIFLDLATREKLEVALRRTQNAQEHIQEKQNKIKRVQAEYRRAIAQLNLHITATDDVLLRLAEAQELSLKLAQNICMQSKNTKEAERAFIKAKKETEKLEDTHSSLTKENNKLFHLERNKLQRKRQALKRIQNLQQIQAHEEERIIDLQEQSDTIFAQLPITRTNILLLLFGLAMLLFGGIQLIARLYFHIDIVDISFISQSQKLQEFFPLVVNIPLSYTIQSSFALLLFLIGFTIIYMNVPQTNSNRKQKILLLNQVENRKDASLKKFYKNEEELLEQYKKLHLDSPTQDDIDELEFQLEEEYEQLINKENLFKKISKTEDELNHLKNEQNKAYKHFKTEEKKIQVLRNKWQNHFFNLSISDTPSPETAEIYFTRIEQIRSIKQNLKDLDNELLAIRNASKHLISLVQEAFPEFSKEEYTPESIILKTEEKLKLCQEEDKVKERKQYTEEKIQELKEKLKNIELTLEQKQEKHSHLKEKAKNIKETWNTYLDNQNFDANLSPQVTKNRLAQADKCQSILAQLETQKEELRIQENEINRLSIPLQNILNHLKIKAKRTLDQKPDYLITLYELHENAEKAKEILNAKISLEEQLAQLQHDINNLQQEDTNINKNIEALLASVELQSIREFDAYVYSKKELNLLSEEKQNLEDKLQFLARDKKLPDFLKEFENVELATLHSQEGRLEEEIQDILKKEEESTNTLAEQKAQIQNLENSSLLSELRQKKTSIEEQNKNALENYLSYALARSFIQKAKQDFEKEKQPELIKTASEIFSHITDGKWLNITSSIEDNTLHLNPKRGVPVTPDELSQGTREQLYLALRLAYVRNASEYKEPLPLIMDDILVNFDTLRSTQTAKTLATFTEGKQAHQMLFFTCHKHIATILQENVPTSTLYTIHNGKISRA